MGIRKEQKKERYQMILGAGLDQFIRRGYAGTKIKDIAEAANMSVGLLFHYFESKEALYIELIRLGVEAPKNMVQAVDTVNPLDFFSTCAEKTLFLARESMFTAKMFVLMSNAYYSEGIPKKAREIAMSSSFYHLLTPLIEQGQQQGSIRQGNPLALCLAFWTALQGSIEAYARTPELPLPEPEWIIDIIRNQEREEN